ncbi:unnamed protein product [Meganyctiphanes norvegica]|uniref:VWFD domain-containing protein n=1 Tax=Meganyctiphanes norvegica TaxID=48144 RepID=A0AAV2QYI9_MEGNR
MNITLALVVSLFAVTWANDAIDTSLRHGGGYWWNGGDRHCVGGCCDYKRCCRFVNYHHYFRRCCYYNGCCPSCKSIPTTNTPENTTPAPVPTTTPKPVLCEDKQGCCALVHRPILYIACIKANGCAPSCGGLGYIIKPTCTEARECCDYKFLSSDFNICCTNFGCCPPCKTSDKKCKPKKKCTDAGGVCKKSCDDGEEQLQGKACKGKKCKCCVTKEVVITPDCVNATECCIFKAGTGDFYACCAKYNCCPMCAASGCPFGNETYNDGEVIRSYPEKCFELKCSLTTITEVQHSDSCSCCTLAGKMYANGYLLTDDDNCIAVQCVEGEWVNQGYINANCRACQLQTPLVAIRTFDGSAYIYGEGDCRYSMVQTPKDPSTSYIHVEFVPDDKNDLPYFQNEQLYFQDTGAAEVSCPGADPINDCSYGPITSSPQEVTSVGTLAFDWTFGTLPFSVIMGVNKISVMYNDDTLIVLAPQSMYGELEGLCGEYNGDSSDDLTMSTGQITTDGNVFAQSWHSSTQSGSNCSLLGPDGGTRRVAAIQQQLFRHHLTNNELAVRNCADMEEEDLKAYESRCKAYIDRPVSDTDEQLVMCMQVSCLCTPEEEDKCMDVFKSMHKLVEEIAMRTIDVDKMHKLLDLNTCNNRVTGTFPPFHETTSY